MKLKIKKFDELSTQELYKILKTRVQVFVVEQNCPYNDLDGKDYDCTHIFMEEGDQILAYLRVLNPGVSYVESSLGRVLVTESARGKGLAKKIVQTGIDYILNELNEDSITIGAQNYLKNFYESLGFKAISEVYLEDNIPHIDMTLNKAIDK
ncbi:GNAT family N-acetyltransferase [uncultured Cetobacterium sp.]|uniref:GNAT family N-acetyltransferase n=1 Tax=uncultured Cetobacterium sp. TaxID=527638 RepID=UPI00262D6668|nr:GNAT family N-acetyltransferase [uncultured Cetobacterium sp.]